MAVDTRDRRSACLGIARANWSPVLLNPSLTRATLGWEQADRQHTAYSYSGIAAGAAVAATGRLLLLGAGSWLLWLLLHGWGSL